MYYDKLLCDIYIHQNKGTIIICGDFNSRCGDEPDYIEGVDCVPCRNVIDFTGNEYSDIFMDFLISSNFCMLNGRNYVKKNDFTCSSVVDLCLISNSDIHILDNFSVFRPSDVVNLVKFQQPSGIPDHSLLIGLFTIHLTMYLFDGIS